jgi:hypothetical protein
MRELLCRVIGHRRSVAHARFVGAGWTSVCKRCGTKLVRVAPKHWDEAPGQVAACSPGSEHDASFIATKTTTAGTAPTRSEAAHNRS